MTKLEEATWNYVEKSYYDLGIEDSFTAGAEWALKENQELLEEVDEFLAAWEDIEHGEVGRRITELRGRLQFIYK